MESKKFKSKAESRPEAKIQQDILDYLRQRQWFCKPTHGNAYQDGFPDIFACHPSYGQRWIEVKRPDMKGSKFQASQLRDFPLMCANGSGVWVLTGATQREYNRLFVSPNWHTYLAEWMK